MARYFFHIRTNCRFTDREGMELDDNSAARHEAIRTAGEMMRDGGATFWQTRPWSVTVTDGAGRLILEIAMEGRAFSALQDHDS